MCSPEKLKELERMDEESYQFYFKDGPKPTWTEEQWSELRSYQVKRLSERHRKMMKSQSDMTDQEKKELDIQFQEIQTKAKAEVAAEENI